MWWDKKSLLKDTKKVLAEKKFQGTSLFLGVANTMDDGMTINKVLKDTSNNTRHIRSILELRSSFENNKQNGLKYQGKYYSDDTHSSVPLITEYDALHFLFNFYPLKLSSKEYTDTTSALVDKYEKHFYNVSKQMGYKVKPSESLINGMGYQALASKQFKKAERCFKYNVDNYPESFNVFDSMGDYYDAVNDKLNAIKYFEKALTIKENAETKKKLEKLK
jgi:tetratricopeptide (TPR) repeat protein